MFKKSAEAALICHPVEPGAVVPPGSINDRCDSCKRAVWIAPTGQARMREEKMLVYCVGCGMRKLAADPDAELQPIAPDQMAEIIGTLRRN